MIRNCILENGYWYCVYFGDVFNGRVENCIIRYGYRNCLNLYYSEGNIIENNIIEGADRNSNIHLQRSHNNRITSNIVNKSKRRGIQLYVSSYNTVENNLVVDCPEGIATSWNDANIISANKIVNCFTGIFAEISIDHVIEGNLIENCQRCGIRFNRSTHTHVGKYAVSSNIIRNCGYGIWIDNYVYSSSFENNFIENCDIGVAITGSRDWYPANNRLSFNIVRGCQTGVVLSRAEGSRLENITIENCQRCLIIENHPFQTFYSGFFVDGLVAILNSRNSIFYRSYLDTVVLDNSYYNTFDDVIFGNAENLPLIENITVENITETTATIVWDTTRFATSRIDYCYNCCDNYCDNYCDNDPKIQHSITLTNLIPGVVYHFQIASTDNEYYNTVISFDHTFTMPNRRWSIFINGDNEFTIYNGVRSGSGEENNPYVIENWEIYASGAPCVWVQNTTKYFVIRNCLLENGYNDYDGIHFENVVNGRVENCVVRYCASGISVSSSSNNTILANTIENCENGISLLSSRNNFVSSIVSQAGLVLLNSYHNTIYNSTFPHIAVTDSMYNVFDDVLFWSAENLPVIENIVVEGITKRAAVVIWATTLPADSELCYGLTENYGYTIYDNTPKIQHKIIIEGLSPGMSYHFQVASTDNFLYNKVISFDYVFTTLIVDVVPPSVPSLLSPPDGSATGTDVLLVWTESTDDDSGVAGYYVSIDGVIYQTTETTLRINLSAGRHLWKVRSVDGAGNYSDWSDEWSFTVTVSPVYYPVEIYLLEPIAGTITNNPVTFAWVSRGRTPANYKVVVATDPYLNNIVATATTEKERISLTLEGTRHYWWGVFALDSGGEVIGSSFADFWVDTVAPQIEANLRSGATIARDQAENIQIVVIDDTRLWGVAFEFIYENLGHTYRIAEGFPEIFCLTVDTKGLPNGAYTLRIVAKDMAGNTTDKEIVFEIGTAGGRLSDIIIPIAMQQVVFTINTDKAEYAPGENMLIQIRATSSLNIPFCAQVEISINGRPAGVSLMYVEPGWFGRADTLASAPEVPGLFTVSAKVQDRTVASSNFAVVKQAEGAGFYHYIWAVVLFVLVIGLGARLRSKIIPRIPHDLGGYP